MRTNRLVVAGFVVVPESAVVAEAVGRDLDRDCVIQASSRRYSRLAVAGCLKGKEILCELQPSVDAGKSSNRNEWRLKYGMRAGTIQSTVFEQMTGRKMKLSVLIFTYERSRGVADCELLIDWAKLDIVELLGRWPGNAPVPIGRPPAGNAHVALFATHRLSAQYIESYIRFAIKPYQSCHSVTCCSCFLVALVVVGLRTYSGAREEIEVQRL